MNVMLVSMDEQVYAEMFMSMYTQMQAHTYMQINKNKTGK